MLENLFQREFAGKADTMPKAMYSIYGILNRLIRGITTATCYAKFFPTPIIVFASLHLLISHLSR